MKYHNRAFPISVSTLQPMAESVRVVMRRPQGSAEAWLKKLGLVACFLASAPAMAQVSLGAAQNFSVLAGSAVTNTGATVVTGDLGVSPGTSVTGFPPGVVNGLIHAGDPAAATAQVALTAAYNAATGLPCTTNLTGQDLGALTLTPGVYCFASSAQLTGPLTLNMQGNPNAAFVFQVGSSLTTASASSVVLTNTGGATCAANLYWQVGSSATLGTGTAFMGNILAFTSITLTTGASVNGRLLASNGAVTNDSNAVTLCAAVAPPALVPISVPTLGYGALLMLTALLAGAGLFLRKVRLS